MFGLFKDESKKKRVDELMDASMARCKQLMAISEDIMRLHDMKEQATKDGYEAEVVRIETLMTRCKEREAAISEQSARDSAELTELLKVSPEEKLASFREELGKYERKYN